MPARPGLVARFCETLRCEEVFWKLYADPGDARRKLEIFQRRRGILRSEHPWQLGGPRFIKDRARHLALPKADAAKRLSATTAPRANQNSHRARRPPSLEVCGPLVRIERRARGDVRS